MGAALGEEDADDGRSLEVGAAESEVGVADWRALSWPEERQSEASHAPRAEDARTRSTAVGRVGRQTPGQPLRVGHPLRRRRSPTGLKCSARAVTAGTASEGPPMVLETRANATATPASRRKLSIVQRLRNECGKQRARSCWESSAARDTRVWEGTEEESP